MEAQTAGVIGCPAPGSVLLAPPNRPFPAIWMGPNKIEPWPKPDNGISIRYVRKFDPLLGELFRFDVLYGFAAVRPELAFMVEDAGEGAVIVADSDFQLSDCNGLVLWQEMTREAFAERYPDAA